MAYTIVKQTDKFENKTTISMNKSFETSKRGLFDTSWAYLGIRYLSMPGSDGIYIDFVFEKCVPNSEWHSGFLWLCSGKIVLRLNDMENLTYDFILSDSKREINTMNEYNKSCREYNFFKISNEDLEKICQAESIEIKVTGKGDTEVYTAEQCDGFIEYCKYFYDRAILGKVDDVVQPDKSKKSHLWMVLIPLIIAIIVFFIFICTL